MISGVEEARKAVRQAFYDGADCIKVIVNTGPRVVSLDELKVIVDEAIALAGRFLPTPSATSRRESPRKLG